MKLTEFYAPQAAKQNPQVRIGPDRCWCLSPDRSGRLLIRGVFFQAGFELFQ